MRDSNTRRLTVINLKGVACIRNALIFRTVMGRIKSYEHIDVYLFFHSVFEQYLLYL